MAVPSPVTRSSLVLSFFYLIISTLAWNRPNDLSLSTVNVTAFGCTAACQKLLTQGITTDRTEVYGNIPFSDSFYATSASFNAQTSKPGDLLKHEAYIHSAPTTAWSLPGGTTLFRIQYVSLGFKNTPVPATAFVAFPFAVPACGKYNLVSFAHGTIGTTYGCAPSTSFNLYDYDTVSPLILSGYAVVGADYAGLGNNGSTVFWEANTLNANDAIYAAVAARKAFPSWLSEEWVAVGHSQGGGTAWGVGESAQLADAAGLGATCIGSVALEPGVRFADEVEYAIGVASSKGAPATAIVALAAYSSFVYSAVDAFDPSVVPDIFTPAMIARQKLGLELGMCFYLEAALVEDIVVGEGLSAIISNFTLLNDTLQEYQKVTGAGIGATAKVPMLVVQSVADQTVPYPPVQMAWETTCAAGGKPVEFSVYHALDHSAAASASAPEWLGWVGDRFAGVQGVSKCTVHHRRAVDVQAAYLPLDF